MSEVFAYLGKTEVSAIQYLQAEIKRKLTLAVVILAIDYFYTSKCWVNQECY